VKECLCNSHMRHTTLTLLAVLAICQINIPRRAESQAQTPTTFAAAPVVSPPTAVLVLSGDASGNIVAVPDASQPKNRQWQVPVNLKELAEASLLSDMRQRFTNVQEAPTLGVARGLADLIVVIDVSESSYVTHYSFGFSPGTATISFIVTFTAIAKSGAHLAKAVPATGVVPLPKPYAIGPMDFAQIPALFKAKLDEAFIVFLDSPETHAFVGSVQNNQNGSQPTNVTASQPYSGPTNGERVTGGKNDNEAPPYNDLVGATQESPALTNARSREPSYLQNSNMAPNHSTACAIAIAAPVAHGSFMVNGPANIRCGGRTDSEIDAITLSRCDGCTIAAHFTHACASYSASGGINRPSPANTVHAFAIVPMARDGADLEAEKEARRQAIEKCNANGGIQCFTGLVTCDEGNYTIISQSKGVAH
jgi:hypothetical protein